VDRLLSGQPYGSIPNIAYRKNGKAVPTALSSPVKTNLSYGNRPINPIFTARRVHVMMSTNFFGGANMTERQDYGVDCQEAKPTDATPEDRRRQFEEHMRRWRSSGLTQAEYCRRNELKWSTFNYWRKRLAASATTVSLVQVPVGFDNDGSGPSGQGLTLFLGDRYKVEIGDNFNPSTLVRLVDTLGQM